MIEFWGRLVRAVLECATMILWGLRCLSAVVSATLDVGVEGRLPTERMIILI